MSKRKPFNDVAGYIASKKNPLTGTSNVIYLASEQGIDADGKYVTVCEGHGQMVSSTSIPKARIDMNDASKWCSECEKSGAKVTRPRDLSATTSMSGYRDFPREKDYSDEPVSLTRPGY